MLVAYLDETYLKNKEHALIAFVVPANEIHCLETDLNALVAKARKQHDGLPENVELHGYELSGGENDWENIPPRARSRIYKEAIDLITQVDGAFMCRGSVDLATRSPGDAHEWALKIALECVNSASGKRSEKVIGICDDVGNKSVYQSMYAHARVHGTGGRFPQYLENFTDGLHFTPSCHSRLVQAVDLLSYVYRRKKINPFNDPRARNVIDDCWARMLPLIAEGNARTW